ncbi:zygote arrest protein 1 isoform X2 [Anolis carolinensis]|uniref:zygote arrest protein 1 isoform X2 n=1 Tax=Anolis carolinensis TaxID=28377 RepID=UPI000462653F|nr:PREDICTED: zygote arrest protein 1 isoform X2 [Anolis carolinensis]|eukprot:XP_008115822.1 PREDICTED: zygote arrest protein 1 isoform X2 [Anolis carolinensis]
MAEAMESYAYPSYNPYSYHRYPPPKGKGGPGSWRQRGGGVGGGGGGGYFSGYNETVAEYFEHYQRAQLKALLSQVNPHLTPRLRRANTKEVGVQVNPRQDASVQCSLGPRPLLLLRQRQRQRQEQGSAVSGAARAVRFPRTVAVYSPVASRRLTAFVEEEEEEGEGDKKEVDKQGSEKPQGETQEEEGKEEKPEKEEEQAAGKAEEAAQSKARVRFQFLEQKYGYYHCKDCNIRWESAYVWCVQGTNKSCKQTRCTCPVKLRHVDPKRPHRQDLCGRCKGKRLSCDSTFSFKYII